MFHVLVGDAGLGAEDVGAVSAASSGEASCDLWPDSCTFLDDDDEDLAGDALCNTRLSAVFSIVTSGGATSRVDMLDDARRRLFVACTAV
jgi:hypothetical protein